MRFLHSADLHIDRSFEGLHLLSEKVKAQLPAINQKVLHHLTNVALTEEVDFVLFAGDTFHQARPSLKVQHDFFTEINRLATAEIPVYMLFGNHDYYDPQRYWFSFPENVHLFESETVKTIEGVTKHGESYAISGFSYQHPWIEMDKVPTFPARKAVDYHIGMYHGDQAGTRYAPFSVSEMKHKGYDYWALGHIHVPKILSEQPPIIYPGTPQGKTKKETASGVVLADLTPQGAKIQQLSVAELFWETAHISLSGIREANEVLPRILQQVQSQRGRLLHLVIEDDQQLPSDWLRDAEKNEWISYLNERLAQLEPLQVIYGITASQTAAEKYTLAISEAYLAQSLKLYQDPDIFAEGLAELLQHPMIQRGIDQDSFKADVLAQTAALLQQTFDWAGDSYDHS
ncbi:metallophosphoesterase family protein [Enterococcus sp. RIT-PI-f]|uniref:metallophosphoesterase family protein n=1 Tax=Enterococcus sp. RIT-PI-f TaxID=1690244 RepID=UPI0006BA08C3|nr:DNA repair exonuclease [Enterococcus sp. RIT-PI-f]KPG70321.1 metallophosphoesterase [Enterococcus sp. RIT-PI-f]